ncbi:homeobox-domain-containing protein [Pseudovirgaria hyperparasitica]|uniref:Homeobox-domain-containing protein n=1 Tax=Pseudovirgaria hyperparasitica TaxID=470096 RepID=A0A6A6WGF9_9PEZI|nr:homeobox-domain-containing protein [Pseudovirgaria hyperparasitica]KAF2761130.1 homeobox-domain-containing protein [Pseudovirgaria hyperparasitica]
MVDRLFTPISPPNSPGMSVYHAVPSNSEWQARDLKAIETELVTPEGSMAGLPSEPLGPHVDVDKHSLLRTHEAFPYSVQRPSSHPTPLDSDNSSPTPKQDRTTMSDLGEERQTPINYGGSAPPSPVSRLTPPSPSAAKSDSQDESGDEDCEDDMLDDEEPKRPLTAQELRAQKRKMKRFRLTHNQTRFLMSEFARQAHPDAAHRERLAREIPGLSPRQVQVWFQNRRAKLKRLTSDDRERMMRSRALPEDFDMSHALHSPFGGPPGMGTPLASPGGFSPAFGDGNMVRPLSIDTFRRVSNGTHMSPTGISPAFGGFNFTPPQSATDSISPISGPGDTPFTFPSAPLESPRRTKPFVGPVTTGSCYTSHPQIPRLQVHDRIQRSRAESLTSPLRTSMSYSDGLNGSHDNTSPYGHDGSRTLSNTILPYGMGYCYSPVPGFQASAATRMRSFSGTVPRRIELSSHYTSSRSNTTPQTATYPNFQGSPLLTSQSYEMPHLSAPHHISTFQNSFMRQDAGDAFPPVGAVLGEIADGHSQDGEHHDSNSNNSRY